MYLFTYGKKRFLETFFFSFEDEKIKCLIVGCIERHSPSSP